MSVTETFKVGTAVVTSHSPLSSDIGVVVGYHRHWDENGSRVFLVIEYFNSGEDGVYSHKVIRNPQNCQKFLD